MESSRYWVANGQDALFLGNHFEKNFQGVRVNDPAHDQHFVGNKIEDNEYNIVIEGFDNTTESSEMLLFEANSIQGAEKNGLWVVSGATYGGPIRFTGNTWKLNGFESGGSFDAIKINADADIALDIAAMSNRQGTDAANGITIGSGVSDISIEWTDVDRSEWTSILNDSGTRTRVNGKIELSGAPTASNYDASDVGLDIIDTTGPTRYSVLRDGSVVSE